MGQQSDKMTIRANGQSAGESREDEDDQTRLSFFLLQFEFVNLVKINCLT